jgi:molybdopterin/thiamine biosynthesis adenylyltransferase
MQIDMRMSANDHERVLKHLFRGDHDEHGLALLAAPHAHRAGHRMTLLVQEVVPVRDHEFVPGQHGYRQTTPLFIAQHAGRAGDRGLAYIAAHNHPGARDHVALSRDDIASHNRLFPHLLDLTAGAPVAGIVLGTCSAAGEIWLRGSEPIELDALHVIGPHLQHLAAAPASAHGEPDMRFDRQVRLFGPAGQHILGQMRVGVIGAGGGGSMLIEQLCHLGVREIVAVDYDTVKRLNLSRIVGASPHDARRRLKKIRVAQRLCRQIDRRVTFTGIDGDIGDLEVARQLVDLDFLFLATDTITSRLVFNAIVHQFLIPGIQIGAKVELRPGTTEIEEIYTAVRPVLPDRGCLACAGLIDPMALQRENATDEEREAQNYLGTHEVSDPSVISLNGIAASNAVNTMLFMATGLGDPALLNHRLFFPRDGSVMTVAPRANAECPWCSRGGGSVYAAGDPVDALPCRQPTGSASRSWRSRLRRPLLEGR